MVQWIYRALVMLIVIPFHEAAHAFVSWKLGDPTAKNMGRMSLNPMAHFDPLGALCMVLAGVGWAKPVPTRAYLFKDPKRDMAITAMAGPVANFLLAFVSAVLYKVVMYTAIGLGGGGVLLDVLSTFLYYMIMMNVSLGVFNLIPIPPFDGSRLALAFLPREWYFRIMQYEQQIFIGMFLLLALGVLDRPLGMLNYWAVHFLNNATLFVDRIAMMLL